MESENTVIDGELREAEYDKTVEDAENVIPPFKPIDWPMVWLTRVSQQHMRNATAVLAPYGVTHREFRMLIELSIAPGVGVGELAEITSIERPTTSKMIDRLIGYGFIDRKSSDEDQRRTRLYLTAAGRKKCHETVPIVLDLFRQYAEDLPSKDFEVLMGILHRLHASVTRVGRELGGE